MSLLPVFLADEQKHNRKNTLGFRITLKAFAKFSPERRLFAVQNLIVDS
jgi:hypothetical protein